MTPSNITYVLDVSELGKIGAGSTGSAPVPRRGTVVHNADGSFHVVGYSVTAKALEKHARKFGPDGVEEIAVWEGLALPADVTRKLPQKRRTTVGLKQQVADLRARGVLPSGIANVLNISERRARAILRDLEQVSNEPK
jgi:hypothetical protein